MRAFAIRLIERAAEGGDPALVLERTKRCGSVLDDPLAEFPTRQAEQTFAEACGDAQLLTSVERARERLLEHIDDDTFAEAD